jgi:hypothetical protein
MQYCTGQEPFRVADDYDEKKSDARVAKINESSVIVPVLINIFPPSTYRYIVFQ